MDVRNGFAFGLHVMDGGRTCAVGAAPAHDQQVAACRAVDFLRRKFVGDVRHFRGPRVDHVLMVVRIVVHIAGDILLFQAADAVFEAGVPGKAQGRASRSSRL